MMPVNVKGNRHMTQYQLVTAGKEKLNEHNVPDADIDAELLWLFVSKQDKMAYIMNRQEDVTETIRSSYEALIDKRSKRIPLQYITGIQCFMGYDFETTPDVLIPRFDTEVLVEQANRLIQDIHSDKMSVLDMCCGSGCIGLSVALMNQNIHIDLCDISDSAIALTTKNAKRLEVSDYTVIKSDLFDKIDKRYDMILSNPPYIESKVIDGLMPEVRDYEPRLALDGDADGLKFYRAIIENAESYLNEKGYILFEIGNHQAHDVQQLLVDKHFEDVRVVKDLAENDRVVIGRKA
ncbi:peptide chain release factor N(5)-glutamine methyltransferase [Coprococcus sp. NSJ-10]|uniref:Release factor glutamine methyltransferase n=2 Tax=Coprococcus hominis (ex Liu et al. 2022) TaxID=2763039 RepID=A0A8I0AFS1_9FIRM|nr:peptide chain release factor N(5)-glutamine methyltransferase [Coprococcus hominis (ex Liu et al. 2022)]